MKPTAVNKKTLLWKLNCPESAKLVRADESVRAPIPAASYPAGLKIASEIRARTDVEIGPISWFLFVFFFCLFWEGPPIERGRPLLFTFLSD